MQFKKGDLLWSSYGRREELFMLTHSNYFFNEEIFSEFKELEEGIWIQKCHNKYGGANFFHLPEKSERVKEIMKRGLGRIVFEEIGGLIIKLHQKYYEYSDVNSMEPKTYDWARRE